MREGSASKHVKGSSIYISRLIRSGNRQTLPLLGSLPRWSDVPSCTQPGGLNRSAHFHGRVSVTKDATDRQCLNKQPCRSTLYILISIIPLSSQPTAAYRSNQSSAKSDNGRVHVMIDPLLGVDSDPGHRPMPHAGRLQHVLLRLVGIPGTGHAAVQCDSSEEWSYSTVTGR